MPPVRNHRYLLPKITATMIAKHVSEALRKEHAPVHAAVKQIEHITGISAMTATGHSMQKLYELQAYGQAVVLQNDIIKVRGSYVRSCVDSFAGWGMNTSWHPPTLLKIKHPTFS